MTADDLVARHIEARGGIDNILAITTLRMSGKVKMQLADVGLYVERKRPDLLRVEFAAVGQVGKEGWDGDAAWEWNPWKGMEQAQYVHGPPADVLRRSSEFDGPLVRYHEKGHTIGLEGTDTLEGLEVYTLNVTLNDGNNILYYLDAETLLVAATKSVRPIHGGDAAETVTFYEDYRQVEGVFFPFRQLEVAEQAAHKEPLQWEKIIANVPINDRRFILPRLGAEV